jgi:hypothetical protein
MRLGMRLRGPSTASSRRLAAAAPPRACAPRRATGTPLPPRRAAGPCAPRPPRRGAVRAVALLDYVASANDDGVLKLPARTELDPDEVKHVFGYPRELESSYTLGKVRSSTIAAPSMM